MWSELNAHTCVVTGVAGLIGLIAVLKFSKHLLFRKPRKATDVKKEPWLLLILKMFINFRRQGLDKYVQEHNEMFAEAKKTGDHAEVTAHFYDVMGAVIETYYGPNWHFASPTSWRQNCHDALVHLHNTIARLLRLAPGKTALDIGSGMGGMIHDLVHYSGADVTGLTLSTEEVNAGNEAFAKAGLASQCRIIQGDAQEMTPFHDNQFDAAYAVYALKYFTKLDRIFKHAYRVVKPGGLFLIYDIIKTPKFDPKNPEHVKIVADFEYSCGMPSIHTQQGMIEDAAAVGFECLAQLDTSREVPWYYEFDQPLLRWALTSKVVKMLIWVGECIHVLPSSFGRFFEIFIAGNVMGIVWGGEKQIMSGSTILVFRKPAN